MALYGNKDGSPGKHKARTWVYSHLKRNKLYKGFHVVIASRECGDIKYLLNCGVEASQIIACDIDAEAMNIAASFGVRCSPYPGIEETVQWAMELGPVSSINVDLCASQVKALPTLRGVICAAQGFGKQKELPAIFFTYLRARDGMHSSHERRMKLVAETNDLLPNIAGRHKHEEYQSFTRTTIGSPMGVAVFM